MDDYIWGFFHSGKANPDEKIHAVDLDDKGKTLCGLGMFRRGTFVETEYPYADQSYCRKCVEIRGVE